MRRWALTIFLLTFGCAKGEIIKTVRSPEGVTAEIVESRQGASAPNKLQVVLVSANRTKRVTIFKGAGGSQASVFFRKKLVVVQYCHPSNYEVSGYIYSLGDDYRFSDVRITAATVDSQIEGLHLCRESTVG